MLDAVQIRHGADSQPSSVTAINALERLSRRNRPALPGLPAQLARDDDDHRAHPCPPLVAFLRSAQAGRSQGHEDVAIGTGVGVAVTPAQRELSGRPSTPPR